MESTPVHPDDASALRKLAAESVLEVFVVRGLKFMAERGV